MSGVWFGTVSGLDESLLALARSSLWITILLPGLTAMQSLLQGIIVHSKKTRSVTEAVFVYLVSSVIILAVGVAWGGASGAFIALASIAVGELLRTSWFFWRSRETRRILRARDEAPSTPAEA